VTIEPEAPATVFTRFKIIGGAAPCFTAANIEIEMGGKLTGKADTETHSHVTLDESTDTGLLKANGSKASLTTTITTWMEGNEEETVGAETF
jgi:hypothetical protein